MWSLDTLDWKRPSPDDLINKALKRVKAGDVLLCHDMHPGIYLGNFCFCVLE